MKAARFYAAKDIRYEDVEPPVASDNKALIAVEWCGICGTDLHEYVIGPAVIPLPGKPHPSTGETLPVIMGHEFCGRVLHAPSGSHLKEGQAVMVDPRLNCSSCSRCTHGSSNSCGKWGFLGLTGGGGGFSEIVAVEPRMVHVLPDPIPLDVAALIEPLAVAWHAAKASGISSFKGISILILGGGPVGVALSFVLRAKGADQIYVSEPAKKRQKILKSFVNTVFDPTKESLAGRCLALTDGEGIKVVFDCAGVQPAFNDGIASLAHKGTYVNVASWETPISIDSGFLLFKEAVITGSLAYTETDFAEVIAAFAEGKFKGVESMITSRISLVDIVEKGFKNLVENKDDHIKILITPKAELLRSL